MIRILIVDDSLTIRKTVGDRLRNAGIDVVGEAADGREAVSLTHRLRPDVVLMDVVMPGVDGLAATRQIMDEIPTPIVILSGHTDQRDAFKTCDALAAGALEVCAKPATASSRGQADWDSVLLTIAAAAHVTVTRLRVPVTGLSADSTVSVERTASGIPEPRRKLIVMGASTGGLAAVRGILANLSPDSPLPILVAIHCGPRLSTSIAGWLDHECPLKVSEARDGDLLPAGPGVVLTAPPGHNLRISRGRTVLDDAMQCKGCAPSVDELFLSAAEYHGDQTIGVLLTGMGSDGAEGLKRIRDRGGSTIVQDEDSCVVFGMPAAAIRIGAAQHVTPLREIAPLLARLSGSSRRVDRPSGVHS